MFKNFKYDFPAGIVVFLVAVPLCLGIALASGAPLFSGIIAGFIGGIIVTLISGSELGVSGPAAGLAVIVLTAIQDLGSFEIFLLAVVIGGIIQIILGIAKAGIIGYYFPNSVIKGMLAGIGVIIIIKQIPFAMGFYGDQVETIFLAKERTGQAINVLYRAFDLISPGALIITAFSFFILIFWETKYIKRIQALQYVQGPLVTVVGGIVFYVLFQGTAYELVPQQMVQLPIASNFTEFFGQFTLPDFSAITNPQVYISGITIAIIASLETLLCVEATDKLDPYKRVTPTNRELIAQGVGNISSGLIGGIPVTQVIVRSSANIQSGGRTKMAALYHGILILVCVALIPGILNMIPLASLAVILIFVGYKLAKPSLIKAMYQLGWRQFAPFIITIIGIVLTDLLVGIGIGMVVAIFYILLDNYKTPFLVMEDHQVGAIHLKLSEEVTFLNKASIQKTLNAIPPGSKVVIDASLTVNIDHDVIDIIEDFEENAKFKDIDLTIIDRRKSNFHDQIKKFEKLISIDDEDEEDKENAIKKIPQN